jgi:hypothetical protein
MHNNAPKNAQGEMYCASKILETDSSPPIYFAMGPVAMGQLKNWKQKILLEVPAKG